MHLEKRLVEVTPDAGSNNNNNNSDNVVLFVYFQVFFPCADRIGYNWVVEWLAPSASGAVSVWTLV